MGGDSDHRRGRRADRLNDPLFIRSEHCGRHRLTELSPLGKDPDAGCVRSATSARAVWHGAWVLRFLGSVVKRHANIVREPGSGAARSRSPLARYECLRRATLFMNNTIAARLSIKERDRTAQTEPASMTV